MRQSGEGDEDGENAEVRNYRVLRERRIKGGLLMLSRVLGKAWRKK